MTLPFLAGAGFELVQGLSSSRPEELRPPSHGPNNSLPPLSRMINVSLYQSGYHIAEKVASSLGKKWSFFSHTVKEELYSEVSLSLLCLPLTFFFFSSSPRIKEQKNRRYQISPRVGVFLFPRKWGSLRR